MSPKDNNKQVSAAVRILHQKRDASARATHLMVKNDSLITYEKAFEGQAAGEKFFSATFLERKIMSTKTSFKRIALVAASALALGGFSVISAPQASAGSNTAFVVSNLTKVNGVALTAANYTSTSVVVLATAIAIAVPFAAYAGTAENPAIANADAATSAIRFVIVFVDIIFLSIVTDGTIPPVALR